MLPPWAVVFSPGCCCCCSVGPSDCMVCTTPPRSFLDDWVPHDAFLTTTMLFRSLGSWCFSWFEVVCRRAGPRVSPASRVLLREGEPSSGTGGDGGGRSNYSSAHFARDLRHTQHNTARTAARRDHSRRFRKTALAKKKCRCTLVPTWLINALRHILFRIFFILISAPYWSRFGGETTWN